MTSQIYLGNCEDELKNLPDNSVDSVVTDPPYELGFMGKSWDSTGIAYNVEMWQEVLRVLKPGGYLLSFGGSRTYHRMACAIEDAGFEIRDQIMWVYGSGFPKSLDVSKAIDKTAGAKREEWPTLPMQLKGEVGEISKNRRCAICMKALASGNPCQCDRTEKPITDEAKQWVGWGTALKPAHEPIVMARKPLSEKTVAKNVLKHETGAINIEGSRIGDEVRTYGGMSANQPEVGTFRDDNWVPKEIEVTVSGRYPANFIHDGSDEVTELLGEPAKFFYCAKTSKKDRNDGLDGFEEKRPDDRTETGMGTFIEKGVAKQANHHPTVKPTDLMRYLVRMVTPPNGTVLDPFTGSGSTGKAAILEGFNFVGVEQNPEYLKIAEARIKAAETK